MVDHHRLPPRARGLPLNEVKLQRQLDRAVSFSLGVTSFGAIILVMDMLSARTLVYSSEAPLAAMRSLGDRAGARWGMWCTLIGAMMLLPTASAAEILRTITRTGGIGQWALWFKARTSRSPDAREPLEIAKHMLTMERIDGGKWRLETIRTYVRTVTRHKGPIDKAMLIELQAYLKDERRRAEADLLAREDPLVNVGGVNLGATDVMKICDELNDQLWNLRFR